MKQKAMYINNTEKYNWLVLNGTTYLLQVLIVQVIYQLCLHLFQDKSQQELQAYSQIPALRR